MSACAIPQQLDVIEREQRRLRADSTNIVMENTSLRNEMDSVRSSLADTRANLQQMQQDLNALKEKMEEVRYHMDRQIGQSARLGDQRIKELEGRLAKLDGALQAQGTLLKGREEELRSLQEAVRTMPRSKETPSAGSAEEKGAPPGEKAPAEPETVKKDYEEAWKLVEQKEYRTAVARLRDFLKRHPKSTLADNAQYWIGECYYALKEFDQAILAFDEVERQYPDGDKVPAALLKQGFAFAELGNKGDARFKVDARLILQKLIERYPQSEEAVKARQKLKTLES
jgi:tol-pal system protein YbgF